MGGRETIRLQTYAQLTGFANFLSDFFYR